MSWCRAAFRLFLQNNENHDHSRHNAHAHNDPPIRARLWAPAHRDHSVHTAAHRIVAAHLHLLYGHGELFL